METQCEHYECKNEVFESRELTTKKLNPIVREVARCHHPDNPYKNLKTLENPIRCKGEIAHCSLPPSVR